jgi:hypothetical protein
VWNTHNINKPCGQNAAPLLTAGSGNIKNWLSGIINWLMKAMQYRRIVTWRYRSIPCEMSVLHGTKNWASCISRCCAGEITPCTYYAEGWMRPKSRYSEVVTEKFAHAPVSKPVLWFSTSCLSHSSDRPKLAPCSLRYMNEKLKTRCLRLNVTDFSKVVFF